MLVDQMLESGVGCTDEIVGALCEFSQRVVENVEVGKRHRCGQLKTVGPRDNE